MFPCSHIPIFPYSLGHPIVGDYTYNPANRAAEGVEGVGGKGMGIGEGTGTEGTETETGTETGADRSAPAPAERMMLHAYKLRYVLCTVRTVYVLCV
jgi:23S rRNA-/tRNA-specific pseudouridylate synthase